MEPLVLLGYFPLERSGGWAADRRYEQFASSIERLPRRYERSASLIERFPRRYEQSASLIERLPRRYERSAMKKM